MLLVNKLFFAMFAAMMSMTMLLEGRIQTRNYEDQTGKRIYVTEVVCDNVQTLVRSNSEGQSNYQPSYQASAPVDNSGYTQDSQPSYDKEFTTVNLDIAADDLPF